MPTKSANIYQAARLGAGLTQEQAAELLALAAALGCTVDALYREEVTEDAED